MVRSHLTTKFMPRDINKEARAFVKRYNSENENKFEGSYLDYITLGVVRRKVLPDIDDIYTLLKLGNSGIDDTQAELKLQNALESEEYKERGLVGIFCDLCKDLLCIDLVLSPQSKQHAMGLEEKINSALDLELAKSRQKQALQREMCNMFKGTTKDAKVIDKKIENLNEKVESLGQKEQTEEKEEQTQE